MAFLLSAERESPEYLNGDHWQRYMSYLQSHRATMPACAFQIATSSWWYGFENPKGPHDSHLERFEMGDARDQTSDERVCWIRMRLKSAFSGHIQLYYPKVYSYSLAMPEEEYPGHGDWRFDEFSSDGTPSRFTHTIEWADGPTWRITASELIHEYLP